MRTEGRYGEQEVAELSNAAPVPARDSEVKICCVKIGAREKSVIMKIKLEKEISC